MNSIQLKLEKELERLKSMLNAGHELKVIWFLAITPNYQAKLRIKSFSYSYMSREKIRPLKPYGTSSLTTS